MYNSISKKGKQARMIAYNSKAKLEQKIGELQIISKKNHDLALQYRSIGDNDSAEKFAKNAIYVNDQITILRKKSAIYENIGVKISISGIEIDPSEKKNNNILRNTIRSITKVKEKNGVKNSGLIELEDSLNDLDKINDQEERVRSEVERAGYASNPNTAERVEDYLKNLDAELQDQVKSFDGLEKQVNEVKKEFD